MRSIVDEYYRRNKSIIDIENENKRKTQMDYKKRKRLAIYNKYNGRCAYCGKKIELEEFEIDHKTPKADQGKNGKSNLMPTCRSCNKLKTNLNIEEFKEKLSKKGIIKEDLYFQIV